MKHYLGNFVYLDINKQGELLLTADNVTIVLTPQTYENLVRIVSQMLKQREAFLANRTKEQEATVMQRYYAEMITADEDGALVPHSDALSEIAAAEQRGAERERAAMQDAMCVAFVQGAAWWEWMQTNATMWQSDQNDAYERALLLQTEGRLGKRLEERGDHHAHGHKEG